MEGLLGVDVLQLFTDLKVIPCLSGSAFQFSDGSCAPFGNVDNFLSYKQLSQKYKECESVTNTHPETVDAITNFLLNPTRTNFDPIGEVLTESCVESNLDRLFSVDSLGINEESCEYDEVKVSEFNDGISFENGHYHIKLPWNESVRIETQF